MTFTIFTGGNIGAWNILSIAPVTGEGLVPASHLAIAPSASLGDASATPWQLRGVTSHVRYVERAEKNALISVQAGLGRPEATHAALIPIRKSAAWWELTQEERRKIFEDKSHHIAASLKYLPAIARQLYHCRDLGEPFDFLTWFEYAPEHATMFEDLVGVLRATDEWTYVEREVDIRLERAA
jgi:chlorite dismutase